MTAKSHRLPVTPWTVYSLRIWALDTPAPNDNTPIPPSLEDEIENLPPAGSRWAVSRFDATDNGTRIAQAITDGKAIALSADGSFKDGFGTSALIIEAEDHSEDNIIAVNVVPGNTKDQGSYRSELAGIFFGQVIMVNTICKVHGITTSDIRERSNALAMEKVPLIKYSARRMKPIRTVANSICFQLHEQERRSKQVQLCGNFATSNGTKKTISSLRQTSIGGRS
jgi:hypothetical protein